MNIVTNIVGTQETRERGGEKKKKEEKNKAEPTRDETTTTTTTMADRPQTHIGRPRSAGAAVATSYVADDCKEVFLNLVWA